MKNLFRELFHISKNGKISEKAMLMRVARTVVMTVFCLAAMGITAYAYFSHGVTSGSNIIKAATFEASVTITDEQGASVPVSTSDHKTYTAELEGNKKYFITAQPAGASTAETGFVIVSAEGNGNQYHTQQLGKDGEDHTEEISFFLVLGDSTTVTFLSHWGTSSCYGYKSDSEKYIVTGEIVKIAVNGKAVSEEQDGEDESEQTGTKENESAEVIHTVSENENLTRIAELYQTTPERIAAYNDIEDKNTIQLGQRIKIPPADWVMTENDDTSAPEAAAPEEEKEPE